MILKETEIAGLIELHPTLLNDDRGWFMESYNKATFAKLNLHMDFVQDNLSFSKAGVMRGLHFQNKPYEQGKLVKVIAGEVLDVAVDLRPDSTTFGRHYKVVLTAGQQNMFYIPEGFAHGFVALSDAYLFYKCTRNYHHPADSGIRFDDPDFNIDWGVANPIISEKDKNLQSFKAYKSALGLL
ncbi:MAG: dTDP-4-dehydrorhamnose 3,5-epimerase [Cyclobacteriaceae bacterium]|nr:dTDP-4-dehydrorhamnose 3,5-epimerase [Cyclobacteriaceae bacterium]